MAVYITSVQPSFIAIRNIDMYAWEEMRSRTTTSIERLTRGKVSNCLRFLMKQNNCILIEEVINSKHMVKRIKLPSFFPGPKIYRTKEKDSTAERQTGRWIPYWENLLTADWILRAERHGALENRWMHFGRTSENNGWSFRLPAWIQIWISIVECSSWSQEQRFWRSPPSRRTRWITSETNRSWVHRPDMSRWLPRFYDRTLDFCDQSRQYECIWSLQWQSYWPARQSLPSS